MKPILVCAAALMFPAFLLFLPSLPAHGADQPAKPASPADAMKANYPDLALQGSLRQAVEAVQQKTGVTIEVDWRTVEAAGIKAGTTVSVTAPKATAGQLLDAALAQAAMDKPPLTWLVDGEVVRVTTQRAALSRNGRTYLDMDVTASPKPSATATGKSPATRPADAAAPAPIPRVAMMSGINLENMPLGDALDFFRAAADVNMHVNWRALAAVNIDRNTPVSLKASDITISRAMDLIFSDLNAGKNKFDSVYWVVDGGILLISSGTALDAEMRVKVFDVADLLMPVPNFPGPVMNVNAATPGAGGSGGGGGGGNNGLFTAAADNAGAAEESAGQLRKDIQDNLIGALKESIGNDFWQPNGKGSIRLMQKKLIVSQSLLGYKLMEKATGG